MPRTTPTPEVTFAGTEFEGRTAASVKNTLYNQALQEVRNRHEDEFFEVVEALYEAHGLSYKRRLTEDQKAEQQARAILAANPGLAARLAAEYAPSVGVEDGPDDVIPE